MKVLGEKVLLKEIERKKNEINGIAIPDSAQKSGMIFEVVSIGDCVYDVEVGDKVIVGNYVGTEIVKDSITYKVVEEEDILAKVEE